MKINFPDGQTYTPGVAQTFTIVITDPVARGLRFSADRAPGKRSGKWAGGRFHCRAQQLVLCDDGDVKRNGVCRANTPIQFIEHSDPFRTNTITVSWTPPATNVGNVHLYIAANAANGDGNNTGDHIYTADYVLTPQAAGAGAVDHKRGKRRRFQSECRARLRHMARDQGRGFDHHPLLGRRRLQWRESAHVARWVSVTVNGLPGYVSYISPTQVNVQAPDDPPSAPACPIQVSPTASRATA